MIQVADNPFVICKAAAGSGKTFTLVKEYLKLAMSLQGATVRHDRTAWERHLRRRFAGILAITFTNKAAGEMKARVMDSLEQMSAFGIDAEKSRMGAPLLEALNAMSCYADQPLTEADLRWMASVVHSAILHRYSDLSVCTIDSFMHRIVRTFAHDLDRPVNFEVMVDQEDIIAHAVERVMALVGTEGNEKLTQVVQAYADSRMEEDKSYRIEGDLASLAGQLFREDTERHLEALAKLKPSDYIEMQHALSEQCKRFKDQVTACGVQMMQKLAGLGVADIDCAGGAKGFYGFFKGVSEGKLRPLTVTAARAFEEGRLCSAKCPKEMREVLEASAPDLTDIYLEIRNLVGVASGAEEGEGQPLRDHNTRLILLRNLYSMALLGTLADQMNLYARENEVVHLSEFNRLIGDIVAGQPAPFIYERLGNRYSHFLIDEFQDTSVLQWHNLVPLVENGVSQREESLVVGDGKQAIYRFRQGDVRQFVELPRVSGMPLHGHTLSMEGNFSVMKLDTNYRTARRVVEFNNAFFSWVLQHEPFAANPLAQSIYIGERDEEGRPELYQRLPAKNEAEGYVEVRFTNRNDEEDLYEYIRQTIVRLVAEQGYRQSDIMVLGRDRRDLDRVGTYLQTHREGMRIDVTSSESFFLTRSHAVMAVIAVLRLLQDPADRVAAADLMQRLYNLDIVSDVHADDFLESGPVDVAALLRKEGRGLDLNLDYLAALDLYDCCEEIVRRLHLDAIDVAYVGSLLGKVADFGNRRHDGVGAFLKWFDDNASADFASGKHRQLSAASPEGIDAVNLLTIHKAKGLESPVVICPLFQRPGKDFRLWVDVDEGIDLGGKKLPSAYVELNRNTSTRFDPERDEEQQLDEVDRLNILYVALTRPQEQLFVVCPEPGEKSTSEAVSYPRLLQAFMAECHPECGDPHFVHRSREAASASEVATVNLSKLTYADWTTKVQVASPAEEALTPLMEERVRFGNWLHEVMAHVEYAADVDKALADFAATHPQAEDARLRFEELVHRVVSHPDCERFFREGYGVKTECDLVDAYGVARPDRIVVTPDATWVVDFKTGRDMGEEHDRQVRRYCAALTEMGYPHVSGWLIYVDDEVKVRYVSGI